MRVVSCECSHCALRCECCVQSNLSFCCAGQMGYLVVIYTVICVDKSRLNALQKSQTPFPGWP